MLMKETNTSTNLPEEDNIDEWKLPVYPAEDDIYHKSKKEGSIDPADVDKRKASNEKKGTANEKEFEEDISGNDLDVPGSELDDDMEDIGSEDEENNFYSIGGDNHNDLEEEKES